MKQLIFGLTFLMIFTGFTGHEPPYPQDYFRSPLGIPLYLSGSFGEMRSNHFHAGLDLKTNDQEGYRVYAAAEGHISRIKVSSGGYGLALYMDHPNGYTTVYAHLSRLTPALAAYVKRIQYQRESFAIDVAVPAGRFSFLKGEKIALSGNSGGSTGPHVHFEIRDSGTEWPINPVLFGIKVEDDIAPRIYRIKIYPANRESFALINDKTRSQPILATYDNPAILSVTREGSSFSLKNVEQIRVHGDVGFGIQTHDYHNGSRSRLGAYQISLMANDDTLYRSEIAQFSFAHTRYINAHVDYAERQNNRRWFQRSFVLPGNVLPFYNTLNNGILAVPDDSHQRLQYDVVDSKGNRSTLGFDLVGVGLTADLVPDKFTPAGQLIARNKPFTLSREGIEVKFDANTFYEDLHFSYRVERPSLGVEDYPVYSKVHVLHDNTVPVHKRFTLSITETGLPVELREKAILAKINDEGNVGSAGGEWSNGQLTARLRSFGRYFVTADTVQPEIKALNIVNGRNMGRRSSIRFKIEDKLSGLSDFRGEIDGKWVLFSYDAKNDLIEYVFDSRVSAGNHTLRLEVEDRVGNTAVWEGSFTR